MKKSHNKIPAIALFGRTNVGKSTLFNTLIEKNKALISDIEGTTRDANIALANWQGRQFKVIDTGGIINIKNLAKTTKQNDDIDSLVQQKAREHISRADLIMFLVDAQDGLLPTDKELALILKKIYPKKQNILLVPNKTDNPKLLAQTAVFNKLGFKKMFPISATSGSGVGDLLDEVIKKIPKKSAGNITAEEIINIAIIGKPNVGKSSLLNSILGEEKVIVSPVPHTTREPQNTEIAYKGKNINLIDTAGISKQGQKSAKRAKNKNTLEKFSIKKSIRVLKNADIALLTIDISEDISHQDAKLVEEIIKSGCSVVFVANKWDLIKEKDMKVYTEIIHRHFPFALWVPIVFVSALTGAKVKKILDLAIELSEIRKTEISENALSKFLNSIIKKHAPARGKNNKKPYIYSLKQTEANPPCFAVKVGPKDYLNETYLRYIENRLREKFKLIGTPIAIYVIKPKQVHGKNENK